MQLPLPVFLFLTTLGIEILGLIGHQTIATFLFSIYGSIFSRNENNKVGALKSEVLKLRAELAATSSQDEFAKWARIRRKLDKSTADLDAISSANSKSVFVSIFSKLLWISTTVGPFILNSYYRHAAIFYLPPDWFGPLTWWLGLPSAPLGALACGLWAMLCKRFISLVFRLISDATRLVQIVPVPTTIPPQAPVTPIQKIDHVKDEL